MDIILQRWDAGEVIGLVAVIVGAIVAVTLIVSITKYQLQSLADDTALKKERQQVELALKQKLVDQGLSGRAADQKLNLLLDVEPPAPVGDVARLDTDLATRFGMLDGACVENIEEALAKALASDPGRKKSIIQVIDELVAHGSEHEMIVATARSLASAPTHPAPISLTGV